MIDLFCSALFPDVVNCMQTDNLELKKLVYLYLMNYAKSQPDMAIMAVNTFVKVSCSSKYIIKSALNPVSSDTALLADTTHTTCFLHSSYQYCLLAINYDEYFLYLPKIYRIIFSDDMNHTHALNTLLCESDLNYEVFFLIK